MPQNFAVVFPHSDDLTIFAGGLVRQLVLAGDTGYFIKITNDDKDSYDLSPGETMRRIELETEQVAAALGLTKVYGLGYQNHYLQHGQLIELRHRLITLFRFLRIDTVISFDPWARVEENPDHTLTGLAVEAACWMAGRGHDLPELIDLGLEPRAVGHKYYAARDPQLLDHPVDVTPVLADKRAALRLHRTPMDRMWREHLADHPDRPVTLEEFIESSFLELDDHGRHLEQFRYLGPRESEKKGV
ncbi:PIG-L deacetylase family protein [Microlunatus speluncae]|uniref:PIG-L deacetylase family protein n=1 Tax=Microlunatus speluncae TaxID=2594267 RepID=UPI0012660C9F|nr:PIG-L family deacetylase [Microlunatus speluncae]